MQMYGMTTPQGESQYFSDPSWMKTKVLFGDSAFWNSNAGAASVERGATQLGIVFHKEFGFALTYFDADDANWFSWSGAAQFDSVDVYVGGCRSYYPKVIFVSREMAWEAIKAFCETANRTDQIQWMPSKELNWDFATGLKIKASL